MKIGAYPFASTASIAENLAKIERGISLAAAQNVRLLVFHECALCGYPPIETTLDSINRAELDRALDRIAALARLNGMYLAVGTIRFEADQCFNSLIVFDDQGSIACVYDKTALWGWDTEHFSRGCPSGLFEIDGLRIGLRICFDIRFPELFRSLYRSKADLCIVAFSDTCETANPERLNIIRSHLITRAVENVMPVLSVNSLSRHPTAPTAVFDPDGRLLAETCEESLLIYDHQPTVLTFGRCGRIANSNHFLNIKADESC